jgi:hypothetical protein
MRKHFTNGSVDITKPSSMYVTRSRVAHTNYHGRKKESSSQAGKAPNSEEGSKEDNKEESNEAQELTSLVSFVPLSKNPLRRIF